MSTYSLQYSGEVIQQLLSSIDNLPGYQFMGVATPDYPPARPSRKVFYLASEAGTYTHFDGLTLEQGNLGILKYDNVWSLDQIEGLGSGTNLTGYVSVDSVENLPSEGIPTLGYLIGQDLYLFVGEGGDTLDGKYQNAGQFRGKDGKDGAPGVAKPAYKEVDTLPDASEETMDKLYLVPTETEGLYSIFYTEEDDGVYSWIPLGTTEIQSPVIADDLVTNDPNKALSAKQGKVLNDTLTQLDQEVSQNKSDIVNIQQEVDAIQPIVIEGNVTNAPDEEDITTDENNLLKFADRPTALGQMGYKILRKDKTFAEQVTDANTIYEIRYKFDLDGEEVTIPAGCVLKFEGGKMNNGKLLLNERCVLHGPAELDEIHIKVAGADCVIKDLSLSVSVAKYGVELEYVIVSQDNDVSGLNISNLSIVSSVGGCIKIITDNLQDVVKDIVIDKCSLTFHSMGIELQNHLNGEYLIQQVAISNCRFEIADPADYLYGFAISLTGTGENIDISYCYFSTVYYDLEIVGFNDVKFTNNECENTFSQGLIISSASADVNNIIISDNYFHKGVSLGKIHNSVFSNNLIDSDDTVSSLNFDNCSDVSIIGNRSISSFTEWVLALNSCSNIIVSSNYFESRIVSNGIKLDNSSGCYIFNNVVKLKDKRVAFSDTGTANIIRNLFQTNPGVMWRSYNTVEVFNGDYNYFSWVVVNTGERALTIVISGDINLTGALTIPDRLTLDFSGGRINTASGSAKILTGGGNGPLLTGDIRIGPNISIAGKWSWRSSPLNIDGSRLNPPLSGATSNRPASSDVWAGYNYFDTTLGKSIVWNGTAWVNMDGTALS